MQIRFDQEVMYKQSKSTCQNNICANWPDQQREGSWQFQDRKLIYLFFYTDTFSN